MRSFHEYRLDLGPIARLDLLRTLHIAQLSLREGTSLGLAVSNLGHLEELRISAANLKDSMLVCRSVGSPFDSLLEALCGLPTEIEAARSPTMVDLGFPASLKSLALIDVYHRYDMRSNSSCPLSLTVKQSCVCA